MHGHPQEHSVITVEEVIWRMEDEGCSEYEIQLAKEILDSMENESGPFSNLRNI